MLIQLAAGILVLAYILYRQMQPTPIRESPKAALIVTAIGAFGALKFLQHNDVGVIDVGLLMVSTLLGLGLAFARAQSVVVYRDPTTGTSMSKGTVTTLVLWIAAIAAHFGIDALAGSDIGSATLLFYIGSVLLVQNLVVVAKARRLDPGTTIALKVSDAPGR